MGLKEVPTVKMFNRKADNELELEAANETEAAETEEVSVKVKRRRFINKAKMKYGTYALAISAIVIAAAVAVNVLFGVLAKRVNLDIDISLKGENTLTEENIEFLKTVDIPVKLTVCAPKENYINLDYYVAEKFSLAQSGEQYYEQTLHFLELYPKYSDNITVEFVDLQDPSSNEIAQQYSDSEIGYGDIIVTATNVIDGKEVVRDEIVSYDEIYYLSSDPYSQYYGYSAYVVSGNYFERAVSSAIRNVSSKQTYKVGVIATHCEISGITYMTDTLKLNGYEIEIISDTVISKIDDKYSLLVISSPTEDFAETELEAIDTWLYNNGQRGRGLLFFASPTTPKVPTLYNYLEEWGIAVGEGTLLDTNDSSHEQGDPMTMYYSCLNDEEEKQDVVDAITKKTEVNIGGYKLPFAIVGAAIPLNAITDNDGKISTYVAFETLSESVAVAPLGAGASWKPSSTDTLQRRAGVIVACNEEYVDNESKKSYVVAFASASFVNEAILEKYSVGNMQIAINAANLSVGADSEAFSFYMKSFDAETYSVSEEAYKAIEYIFQWIVPILIIACGIFVFVRRMRR